METKKMKKTSVFSRIHDLFSRRKRPETDKKETVLLQSDLFGVEQREQHGRTLAGVHRLKQGKPKGKLLERLNENEKLLLDVYKQLIEDVKKSRWITPAAEWLLDNFYVIEEQIRLARHHLPKGYSAKLPHLSNTASAGLPRVYDVALEALLHNDNRVDTENLLGIVTTYQSISPLTLGELWAIPIMLRLALIESLARIAARIAARREDRLSANNWADKMLEVVSQEPKNLILTVAEMAKSEPELSSSFVTEFTRRLREAGSALSLPLAWLEQRLFESGVTTEQMVRSENQFLAANQVSISNCIGGLRVVSSTDWRTFVESASLVEKILSRDPAEIYLKMNFSSKDRYRHVVETLARNGSCSEEEVALQAMRLAEEAARKEGKKNRTAHVGYYLIGKGKYRLEKKAKLRPYPLSVFCRLCRKCPLGLYGCAISLLIGFLTLLFAGKALSEGISLAVFAVFLPLLFLSSAHLAIELVNWMTTLVVKPRPLPRLNFSEGIPEEFRTLVVVPTILTNENALKKLVRDLEVRFLGNRDPHLHFALLTDFPDAEVRTLPGDLALTDAARRSIEALNAQYPASEGSTFYLFHRPRLWNSSERIWMGFERKRGKLADLNGYLRGGNVDKFSLIVGDTAILRNIKYVLTLDTDTYLSRGAAAKCVGAMAHILNRPVYSEGKGRVVEGHGILQPRVSSSLPGGNPSPYARMCSAEVGIDPYLHSVSDVYQDLFDEGSFVGKGIYDVDVFERAVGAAFPENRILSHDLLEGCYLRSGLLGEVQLYEEYPPRYLSDVKRRHRWIRGDWQIASWILPRVPGPGGQSLPNPLSVLSRWKILDNLRRSLTAPALLGLLLLTWFASPSPFFWTVAVLCFPLLPPLIVSLAGTLRKSGEMTIEQNVQAVRHLCTRHFSHALFDLACLPYEAFFSLDAVVRTLWRLSVSRVGLLQWVPFSEADRSQGSGFLHTLRKMWIGPAVAAIAAVALPRLNPCAQFVALPVLSGWLLSPLIVWKLSLPMISKQENLSPGQIAFLRRVARKTWAFFEVFVGPEDHWLPPDNYQEYPGPKTARRTSPTNMGLAILANLSAYDFGYISMGRMTERIGYAFQTMASLERHKGHFYNWYDTQTLKPLSPLYVSSVDSGNLAGHLLTLRSELNKLASRKIFTAEIFHGLRDTLEAMKHAVEPGSAALPQLAQLEQDLSGLSLPPETLSGIRLSIERLHTFAVKTITRLETAVTPNHPVWWWLDAFVRQCDDTLGELNCLTPWVEFFSLHPGLKGAEDLDAIPTLESLASLYTRHGDAVAPELLPLLENASRNAADRLTEIERLIGQCDDFTDLEYDFLFDKQRCLLRIGYDVDNLRPDASCYDLLASESRLAVFVGIAQGKLPQSSWFSMGRLLASEGGGTLLSWSGSMFEYLMPLLVMPTYELTLLDATYKGAVTRQIEYGKHRSVPWGISECGYYTFDAGFNYQYRAFGAPGLGLQRNMSEDLVIAPYASALALMVFPAKACANMERLSAEGFENSLYGFYEAIDYSPSRLQRGQPYSLVRSFMAHHQGMTLLSLGNTLLDRPMQNRFESEPVFQATEILLQERMPDTATAYAHAAAQSDVPPGPPAEERAIRVFEEPDGARPEVQMLSNGNYHIMVTHAGSGYSNWKNIAVTRWREDVTCDNWGTFCYIRDLSTGDFWSSAYQPTCKRPDVYRVIFSEGRAEYYRRDRGYDTHTDIVVSPEDDIELRRVRIVNRARKRRAIEITSYAEIVLSDVPADDMHPAFSKLFVQTEILQRQGAILCTRRPRSENEHTPWMVHMAVVHGGKEIEAYYETDRARFIGRGRTAAAPQALTSDLEHGRLSGQEGCVLDPVAAVRYRVVLDAEESVSVDIATGMGETRYAAISLMEKYRDRHFADRVFEMAWSHGQALLRQLNATESDAQMYTHLAASILYANGSLRADPAILARNGRGQSGLWGYSISGDLPIVLLRVEDPANIDLVRQLLQAHAYWRMKGLAVDLVIWNEGQTGYRQLMHDQIMSLIASGFENSLIDRPGGIFVRSVERAAEEDRILIQTVARIVVSDTQGSLTEQADKRSLRETPMPALPPARNRDRSIFKAHHEIPDPFRERKAALIFFNGSGGFTPDGREYVIGTAKNRPTPAPWVNVLANPDFGTVVSESGLATTWSENAHEFRLTPWGNDPVSDCRGEAFYLRDEESGHFWSPTPQPCGGSGEYLTRHGFGYSVFEHQEDGIASELWIYVALDAAVKFAVLKVRNDSGHSRRLSATGYVEWVLGDLRTKTGMHVLTSGVAGEDGPGGIALTARNPYNADFPGRVAFFDVDEAQYGITGDRMEFLGRNGSLEAPAAMSRTGLSGRAGAALDPCGAIQVPFTLENGRERQIVFRLGSGTDWENMRETANRFKGPDAARSVLEAVWQFWSHFLGAVHVETPDPSFDVLVNGWLLYQSLICRLWGRNATYQSGGAFGFRDQLQDTMALVHAAPDMARDQLLLCASRQFVEGDVQHWWHPPSGRGVRTRCSDDYLWLPFAASRYLRATQDASVLSERVPFLEGRPLKPDEESYYDLPTVSEETGSLYDHCVRSIVNGLKFGIHGLPLIGSGDWNDGMDRVGIHGQGESVWLGFFLYDVLTQFQEIARGRGDAAFAERCGAEAAALRENIEKNSWDGEWYRRAYFDDGLPLGSASSSECRIDSIAQSWSVLSGAGKGERTRTAMASLDEHLVMRDAKVIRLFKPPFDTSSVNPGYIKGYAPGVRENGGQYTHAAVWAAMAHAKMGNPDKAWEYLSLLNPVNHARTGDEKDVYKVEPYVVAADVYAVPPHVGRGGWTWYTGSASWMYRLMLESLLGIERLGDRLLLQPLLPLHWDKVTVHYRYGETVYHIGILRKTSGEGTEKEDIGKTTVWLDGTERSDGAIELEDDGAEHWAEVRLGATDSSMEHVL